MTATDDQVEALAYELYQAKAKQEASAHGQGVTPWDQLGESFKHSLREMARAQLEGQP